MLIALFFCTVSLVAPADSVGTEVINGRLFVIHKVDEKETLYSLSRRYGAPIAQILEFNPTADAGLVVGQILKIPYNKRLQHKTNQITVHKVAEKETLFSISRLYQVSVEEIKQWNNLSDNTLAIGQELIIKKTNEITSVPTQTNHIQTVHTVQPGETLFSISRRYGITVEELRMWNNLQGADLKAGQKLFVAQPMYQPADTPGVTTTTIRTDSLPAHTKTEPLTPPVQTPQVVVAPHETLNTTSEVKESGLAELIEGTEGNRKYLAMHRTAPVGTILKVRNEMNNREVFVRVIGKLPDTALNDKLIIKISRSAYDRLGAIDPRFRVEVTFYR